MAACTILVLGLAFSLAGALLWRSSVRGHEKQTFQTTAADVGGTLEMELRRDTDFVSTLRAVLTRQPGLSATDFSRWFTALEGQQRQVGSLGTTVVLSVPAAELATFQARRNADPAFRALVSGGIVPIAPDGRARYCLLSAGGEVTPYSPYLARLLQGDWCNPSSPIGGYPAGGTSQANLMRSLVDGGRLLVYPITLEERPPSLSKARSTGATQASRAARGGARASSAGFRAPSTPPSSYSRRSASIAASQ